MLTDRPSKEVSSIASRNTKRVSVLVMTYNHEKYISQALDSVLMQQTSFDWEVLVSEDCSTDQTRQIVQEYAARHPGLLRLILSEKNLHSNEVVARGIRAAAGQYLALLDGDDYWITSEKLQTQVDFMDRHPESTVCFHQALVHDERAHRPDWNWTPTNQKEISTLQDICMDNFIATSSTMFRRRAIEGPPEWYIAFFPITDWPLHILYAERGTIAYLPKTMSVYRHHEGGAYSGGSQSLKEDEAYRFISVWTKCSITVIADFSRRASSIIFWTGWRSTRGWDRGNKRSRASGARSQAAQSISFRACESWQKPGSGSCCRAVKHELVYGCNAPLCQNSSRCGYGCAAAMVGYDPDVQLRAILAGCFS